MCAFLKSPSVLERPDDLLIAYKTENSILLVEWNECVLIKQHLFLRGKIKSQFWNIKR